MMGRITELQAESTLHPFLIIFFITIGLGLWMKHDNKLREQQQPEAEEILRDMSLHDIQDLKWKHLSFRWR
jgi:hypothetical protein